MNTRALGYFSTLSIAKNLNLKRFETGILKYYDGQILQLSNLRQMLRIFFFFLSFQFSDVQLLGSSSFLIVENSSFFSDLLSSTDYFSFKISKLLIVQASEFSKRQVLKSLSFLALKQ